MIRMARRLEMPGRLGDRMDLLFTLHVPLGDRHISSGQLFERQNIIFN